MKRSPSSGGKLARALLWCCVLTLLIVIFCFSAQDGAASTRASQAVADQVIKIAYPDYPTYTPAEQSRIANDVSRFVRKGAHFLEYMLLGFLFRLLLKSYSLRFGSFWAWLGGTLYACTDEFHQTLVSARAGSWKDVLLDSGGVLAGALVALGVAALLRRARKRRE